MFEYLDVKEAKLVGKKRLLKKEKIYIFFKSDLPTPYTSILHMSLETHKYQWRSSAPKSGGGGGAQTFFKKSEKQKKKKKKKKKVTDRGNRVLLIGEGLLYWIYYQSVLKLY